MGIAPVLLSDVLEAMVLTTADAGGIADEETTAITVGVLVANCAALVVTRLLLVTRVIGTDVLLTLDGTPFARGKVVGTGVTDARVGAPVTAGDEGDKDSKSPSLMAVGVAASVSGGMS